MARKATTSKASSSSRGRSTAPAGKKRAASKKGAKSSASGKKSSGGKGGNKKAAAKKVKAAKKATKKAATKKSAAKKSPAKKPASKKPVSKKPATKKAATKKKSVAKKVAKKKVAKKKVAKKKTTSKKAAKKATSGKKAAGKATRKAATKAVKKAAKKSATSKTAAKKTAAKKTAAPKKSQNTEKPRPRGIRIGAPAGGTKPGRASTVRKTSSTKRPTLLSSATSQDPIQFPEEGRKIPKTYLKAKELREFRDLLLAKRRELAGDVRHLANDAFASSRTDSQSSAPNHMADVGSDYYEHESNLGLIEHEQELIRQIDAALSRIEAKTYGICLATHKPITLARLRAKPWAKYSIEYARAREEGRVR